VGYDPPVSLNNFPRRKSIRRTTPDSCSLNHVTEVARKFIFKADRRLNALLRSAVCLKFECLNYRVVNLRSGRLYYSPSASSHPGRRAQHPAGVFIFVDPSKAPLEKGTGRQHRRAGARMPAMMESVGG
jgi:hypothetical protein